MGFFLLLKTGAELLDSKLPKDLSDVIEIVNFGENYKTRLGDACAKATRLDGFDVIGVRNGTQSQFDEINGQIIEDVLVAKDGPLAGEDGQKWVDFLERPGTMDIGQFMLVNGDEGEKSTIWVERWTRTEIARVISESDDGEVVDAEFEDDEKQTEPEGEKPATQGNGGAC